ncbi:MAG: Bacterial Ig-like domain (group 2), partial [Armatimonadetes bacterium]|nr:Bacterial Ig-like domain (group 2) [Armatimonadota bacterium]
MKAWAAIVGLFAAMVGAPGHAATVSPRAPAAAKTLPQAAAPDFATSILPVLTRASCNSGACHGAAVGRGGFRLSLLGYDPEADYQRITREYGARRVHLANPDASLLLRKAAGLVPHGGGRRLAPTDPRFLRLRRWIAAGAPYGEQRRRLVGLAVTPPDSLLPQVGREVQLAVRARYADGAQEDVTSLALFTSNDDGIAETTPEGRVTVLRRGVATVAVRYLGEVTAVRVGVRFSDAPASAAALLASGPLDRAVGRLLERVGLPPSPPCDDATFLRRLHLDVLGTLPSPEEVRAFLAEPPSDARRRQAIEAALKRPEFNDYWTLKLADLLQLSSRRLGEGPAVAYHTWLRDHVTRGVPLDRTVGSLLRADGSVAENGAANFYRTAADPREQAEFVTRSLLGVRLECARCHNHPFDRWTQDDYYGFAAHFARVRFEGGRIFEGERGEVQHPRSGKDVSPRLLLAGDEAAPGSAKEPAPARKAAVANWMQGPGRRLLARSVANRMARYLLGRGVVEPIDDLRDSNPASNPELLDVLCERLEAVNWDLRRLVAEVVSSRTYQLSSLPNAVNRSDDRFYSHALLRPLTAQVLADAIARATGAAPEYPGYPDGTR